MQQNEFKEVRLEVGRKVKQIFGDKIGSLEFFDIVEVPDHWSFKIRFIAYDYYVILFNYELDIIGFSIENANGIKIPVVKEHNCYSDNQLDDYINKVMENLELRIPDKYLEQNGWK